MTEEEKLKKAILQAAASIWLDDLPLSEEYVEEYYRKRLEELHKKKEEGPILRLKRGEKNEHRN